MERSQSLRVDAVGAAIERGSEAIAFGSSSQLSPLDTSSNSHELLLGQSEAEAEQSANRREPSDELSPRVLLDTLAGSGQGSGEAVGGEEAGERERRAPSQLAHLASDVERGAKLVIFAGARSELGAESAVEHLNNARQILSQLHESLAELGDNVAMARVFVTRTDGLETLRDCIIAAARRIAKAVELLTPAPMEPLEPFVPQADPFEMELAEADRLDAQRVAMYADVDREIEAMRARYHAALEQADGAEGSEP